MADQNRTLSPPGPGKQTTSEEQTSGGSPLKESHPRDNPSEEKELTPEEQMALFEKDLKDNDWGHQPC
jgi:hypothetical protein